MTMTIACDNCGKGQKLAKKRLRKSGQQDSWPSEVQGKSVGLYESFLGQADKNVKRNLKSDIDVWQFMLLNS